MESKREKHDIKANINRLAQVAGESAGVEVVKTQYLKEHGRRILRITINREGGVSLDDCERFSRIFSPLMDEEDFIEEHYYLEVESPGI